LWEALSSPTLGGSYNSLRPVSVLAPFFAENVSVFAENVSVFAENVSVFAENVSVFAENVSVYARRC
jgi:hypothetical protein